MRSALRRVADVLAAPATLLESLWLWLDRRKRVQHVRGGRGVFGGTGVFPVRRHHPEPPFEPRHLRGALRNDRARPGRGPNVAEQLALLAASPPTSRVP